MMCNVYLHRLDRAWRGAYGTYLRYADDAVVMCRAQGQAVAALARLTVLLADLGLEPKAAKTRIVHLRRGAREWTSTASTTGWCGPGSDTGPVASRFWPDGPHARAEQHARDRIRFMTMRARLAAPVEQVLREINLFLRGWAGYFRDGNSANAIDKIRS